MASSSSPSSQRRRPLKKRQPLTRSNSSLFGTIRNIVTAPLTWFASTDDFEDSKDLKGKRRRVVAPQNGTLGQHDGWSTPSKRMRVYSPPRDHQQPDYPSGNSYGYLDPPTSVFQQQHNQPNFFNQPSTAPPVSVSIPVPTMQAYEPLRNNNTLFRGSTLSRTMSIDPPSRPVSRSSAMPSVLPPLNFDNLMETSASLVGHPTRDRSMPPLSARPSFRMRTSMTPQPPQKEASEPPSLSTLVINPMFVRGPSAHGGDHQQPSATLGSLVDSVRSTRSPVRQHSSLLFGTSVENTSNLRQESPAEKALHELDVYKTPLLPTRLRSNIPGSSSLIADSASTNLFKSRRKSNLVLMQDDERVGRLGRKSNVKIDIPLVNETKPYAGEGGMKKLLARRRMEAEKYEQKTEVIGSDDAEEKVHVGVVENHTNDARPTLNGRSDELHTGVDPTRPSSHPPPASKDWYSNASSSSTSASVSSLRVGRTKTRAHIVRPIARPMKTKFSAAYEDDDSMDDVDVPQGESEKQMEREMLDEAAKRAPVFKIPEGFSFAKETNPLEHDSTNAKEPPISSLPFSFTKAKPIPPVSQTDDLHRAQALCTSFLPVATASLAPSDVNTSLPLAAPSSGVQAVSAPSSAPVAEDRPSISPLVEDSRKLQTLAPEADVANVGVNDRNVPNFFASSLAFTKPLEVSRPPVLTFPPSLDPLTPNTTSNIGISHSPTPSAPVKDAENPLWEGERDVKSTTGSPSLLSGFGGTNNGTAQNTNTLAFGTNSLSASPTIPSSHAEVPTEGAVSEHSLFDTPSTRFSFPKLPQIATSTLFGEDIPRAISPSSDVTTSTSQAPPTGGLSDTEPKQSAPSLFTFGEPAPSVTTSREPPKPLFGGTTETSTTIKPAFSENRFSFGNTSSPNNNDQKPASTPFSFGAAPNTPPSADTKNTLPFSFKDSSAPPSSAPVTFSFSGDGGNVNGLTSKPFSSFGSPVTIAPMDRPTTPPKHDDQEVRMEESPTREVQQSTPNGKPVESRPTLGGAFSFGVGTPGPVFGDQSNAAPAPTSFIFGTSASPNPFIKDTKSSDSKPFAGFGQTTASSAPFTFGQKLVGNNDLPRPSTSGSFSFTPAPSSATGPGLTFAFGGPSNNSTGGLFGQTQPSGSAPSSPSTFNQPSPFSFTSQLPTTTNTFAFGSSQPASPAGGNASLSLPQSATPVGFNSGTGGGFGQQPPSPFGAPAPASSGATLFTIGAAPSAPQGARQIRKLPTRRGGAKR